MFLTFIRNFSKHSQKEVYIIDAIRTPIGIFKGGLSSISAPNLGSLTIKSLLKRNGISMDLVEEVFIGNVCQAGLGQSPARQASIGAGINESVDCTTINKVCASGMKAIMLAAQSIILGYRNVMIAGGMENMSKVPFYIARGEIPYGGCKIQDGIVVDGLTDAYNNIHMGVCGEMLAKKMNITRKDQDEFAVMSYKRALEATKKGVFKDEIVPVNVPQKKGKPDITLIEDEEPKRGDFQKFPNLSPAFEKQGTITAANASKINDGACMLLLANQDHTKNPSKFLAKIIAFADGALNPVEFTMAPSIVIPKALDMAKLKISDIDLWEINEAFSVVALGNIRKLNLDINKVNVNGGAVSMGHPLGMSGARIVTHLVHALKKGQKGLAAVCNGGGAASAIIIEKLV
ncbi:unnamed protein product [Gordionus sp. m RMFG-2023]|uniref:acetyl-CoA acetyltransferase A, mitochondrial-like isoform X2 n=1 Tax=Gordionus sp. m RMFG-2023 TaxID=3053472 RepID=UPI0030E5097F